MYARPIALALLLAALLTTTVGIQVPLSPLILTCAATAAGIVAGGLFVRHPVGGGSALVVAGVPLAGYALAGVFC